MKKFNRVVTSAQIADFQESLAFNYNVKEEKQKYIHRNSRVYVYMYIECNNCRKIQK